MAGTGLAHPLGHLLLGQAVLLHEHLVAPGLLGGVQVLPLEVLDQAQLHHLPVVRLDDDGGHLRQAGGLGRPPPALAGDDLIVPRGQPPDRQGLDDPVGADGLGELGQGLLVEPLPGLIEPRLHLGDGQGDRALALGGEGGVAQQGVQPPAQSQFCLSFRHTRSFL